MTADVDLSEMFQPRSDQLNADDLIGGPVTVTIVDVTKGNSPEQPVNLVTDHYGEGRPYKPNKSMGRVLRNVWGSNGGRYIGRSLTLYNDPTVKFGRDTLGGIRISHMSHIDAPKSTLLTVTRGKRVNFTVEPLPSGPPLVTDEVAGQFAADILAASDQPALDAITAELKKHNLGAHRGDLIAAWTARRDELGESA